MRETNPVISLVNTNEEKKIELTVSSNENTVSFKIKDNGKGIPKRIQQKIFDRFYQADQTLSRNTEGCGLGLSIVQFIINAHHGRMEVDSQPGQGSVFTVHLPKL